MEIVTEKRRLIITLAGEEAAPVSYAFEAVRYTRENGVDIAAPAFVSLPATAEDASAYLNTALAAQRDAQATSAGQKAARIAELEAAADVAAQEITTLRAERDAARAAYEQLLSEVEPA